MRQVVFHGARANGCRAGVDRPGHNLDIRGQPERISQLRFERAEHGGAWHDLGQLIAIHPTGRHQLRRIMDRVRAAVVGHPRGQD